MILSTFIYSVEDACPVETIQTELGLKWQVNNRIFILVLTRTTLTFLDPHAGIQALTYNVQSLSYCIISKVATEY